jgi:transposase
MNTCYVGLDVHKASICIAVLNAAGKLVMESVIYRSRAIACAGTDVYKLQRREGWLTKLHGSGARARAERLYSELDHLSGLRREARKALVAECRRHPASKLLSKVPTLGPVRVAQLISAVVTPHRFRGKRQFRSYCGLAVVTGSSGDHQLIGEQVRRNKRAPETRGLTQSHNRTLKYVFKSAALTASRCEPFKTWYLELPARGLRPELARVTMARKIAAITLAVMGEVFP